LKRKLLKIFISIVIIAVLLRFFVYFQNNVLVFSKYVLETKKISEEFNNYKVIQLSDLHSKEFGKNQDRLVSKIIELKPNMITFTGDLVDSTKYNEEISITLMEKLREIAPTYYVTGNHEWWSGKFNYLENELIKLDVKVLRNESEIVTKGSEKILITGIDDPDIQYEFEERQCINNFIKEALLENENFDGFKILLSHRPGDFYKYEDFDLVLSGHAHGGQIRIPFLGGLVAPNQGFLPKFDSGQFNLKNNTKLIVNRGLGNSIIPIRVFNHPEIVEITLKESK
jgi:predicted MPP superfamily phosphohydrolase